MNAYYLQVLYNKKGLRKPLNANKVISNYLFITYIVTSKPKRISVAAGVVHIIISFIKFNTHRVYNSILPQRFACGIRKTMNNRQRKTPPKQGLTYYIAKY